MPLISENTMKANTITMKSYNNEFRWTHVIQILVYTAINMLLISVSFAIFDVLLYYLVDIPMGTYINIEFWVITIGAFIMILVNSIKYFPRLISGHYTIVGNNLIVNEEYFSSKFAVTIPISTISNVRKTSYIIGIKSYWQRGITNFFVPFKMLEIMVEDKEYTLYCITHSDELYLDLRELIKNK